jgi:hypothetical protein
MFCKQEVTGSIPVGSIAVTVFIAAGYMVARS